MLKTTPSWMLYSKKIFRIIRSKNLMWDRLLKDLMWNRLLRDFLWDRLLKKLDVELFAKRLVMGSFAQKLDVELLRICEQEES